MNIQAVDITSLPKWAELLPVWAMTALILMWGSNKYLPDILKSLASFWRSLFSRKFEITEQQFNECKEMLGKHEHKISELEQTIKGMSEKELVTHGELEKLRGYLDAKLGKDYE